MSTPDELLKDMETKLTELEALCEELDGVPDVGRPEIQHRLEEVQFRLSRPDDEVGDQILLESPSSRRRRSSSAARTGRRLLPGCTGMYSDPGETRTHDLGIRNPALSPG